MVRIVHVIEMRINQINLERAIHNTTTGRHFARIIRIHRSLTARLSIIQPPQALLQAVWRCSPPPRVRSVSLCHSQTQHEAKSEGLVRSVALVVAHQMRRMVQPEALGDVWDTGGVGLALAKVLWH